MANIKANPPINLAELSPRLAAGKVSGDEWLVDEELQSLSIFANLKKKIDFRKTPGATYLWRGTPDSPALAPVAGVVAAPLAEISS